MQRKIGNVWGFVASLLILCASPFSLSADELTFDQRNEFDLKGWFVSYAIIQPSLPSPSVSFIPTLKALDFVDLVAGLDGAGEPASLQVLVRRGSTVIGASDVLQITNTPMVTNHFLFYPSVPMVPGNTYTLEVQSLHGMATTVGNPIMFFREGTLVPALVPPPLSIHPSCVDVCWSSRVGKVYQLQYRSEVTTNVWTNLGSPVSGNGLTNCLTDSISGPQRFYRVMMLP
jgi:hypothetical protein